MSEENRKKGRKKKKRREERTQAKLFSQFSMGLGRILQDFTRTTPGPYCTPCPEIFRHPPDASHSVLNTQFSTCVPRTCLVSALPPRIGAIRPFPPSGVGSAHPAGSIGRTQPATQHPGAKRWCQHARSCLACRSCWLLFLFSAQLSHHWEHWFGHWGGQRPRDRPWQ